MFRRWRWDGTWERIHAELRTPARVAAGQKPSPTAILVDSQTASTMLSGDEQDDDSGKKRLGRKRQLTLDTEGWV